MKYSFLLLFAVLFLISCSGDESFESQVSLDTDDTNVLEEVGPQFLDMARELHKEQEQQEGNQGAQVREKKTQLSQTEVGIIENSEQQSQSESQKLVVENATQTPGNTASSTSPQVSETKAPSNIQNNIPIQEEVPQENRGDVKKKQEKYEKEEYEEDNDEYENDED